jgi:hypothetical protein
MADQIDIDKILAEIGDTDLGKQMLSLFKGKTKMPEIEQTGPLPQGAYANYTLGDKIKIDSYKVKRSPEISATVLSHELTHAAELELADAAFGLTSRKLDPYLVEQMRKLTEDSTYEPQRALVKKQGGSEYRASGDEATAFGVSNTLTKGKPVYPIAHVDASQAQEFAIRLDLYNRAHQKSSKRN